MCHSLEASKSQPVQSYPNVYISPVSSPPVLRELRLLCEKYYAILIVTCFPMAAYKE